MLNFNTHDKPADAEFAFTIDGTEYRVPKAKHLPRKQLRGIEDLDGFAAMDQLFAADDALAAALDELQVHQVEALLEAYMADSGLSVGESSASTR